VLLLISLNSGSIASLSRLGYVQSLAARGLDFFVRVQGLAIVSGIELGLGITAASLATLRPLLRRGVQLIGTYRSKSTSRSRPTKSDLEQAYKTDGGVSSLVAKGKHLDTGATTLTANSTAHNNLNFLLSATNMVNSFDEKDDMFLQPTAKAIVPLSTIHTENHFCRERIHNDDHFSPAPVHTDNHFPHKPIHTYNRFFPKTESPSTRLIPQIQMPQEAQNNPDPNRSSEQFRTSWWHSRSRARKCKRDSTEFDTEFNNSQLETQDSPKRRTSDKLLPQPAEPTLEAGFRKWVIRKDAT
jgi:hypothetical protein